MQRRNIIFKLFFLPAAVALGYFGWFLMSIGFALFKPCMKAERKKLHIRQL